MNKKFWTALAVLASVTLACSTLTPDPVAPLAPTAVFTASPATEAPVATEPLAAIETLTSTPTLATTACGEASFFTPEILGEAARLNLVPAVDEVRMNDWAFSISSNTWSTDDGGCSTQITISGGIVYNLYEKTPITLMNGLERLIFVTSSGRNEVGLYPQPEGAAGKDFTSACALVEFIRRETRAFVIVAGDAMKEVCR